MHCQCLTQTGEYEISPPAFCCWGWLSLYVYNGFLFPLRNIFWEDLGKVNTENLFSSSFCKKKCVSIVLLFQWIYSRPEWYPAYPTATNQLSNTSVDICYYNMRSHYYNALREGACTWWIDRMGNSLRVSCRSTQKIVCIHPSTTV